MALGIGTARRARGRVDTQYFQQLGANLLCNSQSLETNEMHAEGAPAANITMHASATATSSQEKEGKPGLSYNSHNNI